jgi:hypothetical protein
MTPLQITELVVLELLTAVAMKISISWDTTPLQRHISPLSSRLKQETSMKQPVLLLPCFMLVPFLA